MIVPKYYRCYDLVSRQYYGWYLTDLERCKAMAVAFTQDVPGTQSIYVASEVDSPCERMGG